jgi:hypothetical protein
LNSKGPSRATVGSRDSLGIMVRMYQRRYISQTAICPRSTGARSSFRNFVFQAGLRGLGVRFVISCFFWRAIDSAKHLKPIKHRSRGRQGIFRPPTRELKVVRGTVVPTTPTTAGAPNATRTHPIRSSTLSSTSRSRMSPSSKSLAKLRSWSVILGSASSSIDLIRTVRRSSVPARRLPQRSSW